MGTYYWMTIDTGYWNGGLILIIGMGINIYYWIWGFILTTAIGDQH